jgi:hypothetical protein
MEQIESQLNAEIAVPNVRAQLHSFYWPEAGEKLVQDREEYYVSRYVEHSVAAGQSAVQIRADGSRTLYATGPLGVHPPQFPVRIRMPSGWHELFMCVFQPTFFEETTGFHSHWRTEELGKLCTRDSASRN